MCFASRGQQRPPRRETMVRIEDGEAGLSARTIARRLSSVAGLFEYVIAVATRAWNAIRCRAGLRVGGWAKRGRGGVRLARRPRTLPRILSPVDVDGRLGAANGARQGEGLPATRRALLLSARDAGRERALRLQGPCR